MATQQEDLPNDVHELPTKMKIKEGEEEEGEQMETKEYAPVRTVRKRKRKVPSRSNGYSRWVKLECASNPSIRGKRDRFKLCSALWKSKTAEERRDILKA